VTPVLTPPSSVTSPVCVILISSGFSSNDFLTSSVVPKSPPNCLPPILSPVGVLSLIGVSPIDP
jgi:hypothetical protein